ncbi:MAG: hypothetical protein NUV82_02425 [Candidatus Komeilibacteria bacterium]|nr:hypothetical protein [Candidatus Komeilibacteria bacterium]
MTLNTDLILIGKEDDGDSHYPTREDFKDEEEVSVGGEEEPELEEQSEDSE